MTIDDASKSKAKLLETLSSLNEAIAVNDWECIAEVMGYTPTIDSRTLQEQYNEGIQRAQEAILKVYPGAILGEFKTTPYQILCLYACNAALIFSVDYQDFRAGGEERRLNGYVVGTFVQNEQGVCGLTPVWAKIVLDDAPSG